MSVSPKLQSASRFMAGLSLFGALLLAILAPVSFLCPGELVHAGGLNLKIEAMLPNGVAITRAVPFGWRLFALAAAALPTGLMVATLVELFRLFRGFAAGRVFEGAVLAHFRRAAHFLFWSVVADIPAQAAILYALGQAKGQFWLGYMISGFEPVFLFAVGVLVVISRVMAEAQRLADENAKFV